MPIPPDIVSLGLALGVGLLVGFERERQPDTVAGVRTFGLAGFLGGLAALATPRDAWPWMLAVVASFAGIAGVAGGVARFLRHAAGEASGRAMSRDIGLTTAFALVATVLLGGYAVLGDRTLTIVAAGVLFLLLYIRDPLHAMIRRLGHEDVRAIATFVLIALVILPVLPDEEIGPLGAINPRKAWLLVVLVVSMSLAGYIAQKMLGTRAGVLATGFLGGLVSSTAATVGASRMARRDGDARAATVVVLLACSVLPARLMVLLGVTSPAALSALWPWLAGMAAATIVGGLLVLRGGEEGRAAHASAAAATPTATPTTTPTATPTTTPAMPTSPTATPADGTANTSTEHSTPNPSTTPRNPTELRSALAFAGVFVVIRFLTKAALSYAGAAAFLLVAAISGITDMDAIAMSAANEVSSGDLAPELAARAILVAIAVNTVFKLGVTRFAGTPALLRKTLPAMALAAAIAVVGAVVG